MFTLFLKRYLCQKTTIAIYPKVTTDRCLEDCEAFVNYYVSMLFVPVWTLIGINNLPIENFTSTDCNLFQVIA